jgi:primosomal protein N'
LPRIAAVRFASPLPQLDREYDYLIPEGMSLVVGSLVEVPFGSGKKAKSGVVAELKELSELLFVHRVNYRMNLVVTLHGEYVFNPVFAHCLFPIIQIASPRP